MAENRRWAELDDNKIVIRVVIYDGDDPTDLFGPNSGPWAEGRPELNPDRGDRRAAPGIGQGHDPSHPVRFAPPISEEGPDRDTFDSDLVFTDGRIKTRRETK